MSRSTHLKIKIKTLAAESHLIRSEEAKALAAGRKGAAKARLAEREGQSEVPLEFRDHYKTHYRSYESLLHHRTGIVREASRVNHLAYGFLRGHAYAAMEAKTSTPLNLYKVFQVVERFGGGADLHAWPAWQKAAAAHLKPQEGSLIIRQPSTTMLQKCETNDERLKRQKGERAQKVRVAESRLRDARRELDVAKVGGAA